MKTKSRTSKIAADQSLIDGVKKHLMKVPTLTLDGTDYTPSQVVDALQSKIDAANAADAAHAALQESLKNETAQNGAKNPFVAALQQLVQAMHGSEPAVLNDFGLAPRKRRQSTAAIKAAAVQKNLATRAARHTVGPIAKLKVKGNVPEPIINAPPPQGSGSIPKG